MSVRFITASLIQSSAFYARTSGSESGSFVSSSFYYGSTKELGEIKGDFIDNKVEVILLSQSFGGTDINVLTISASNRAPRVGIGVTNPIRAFDFKEVRDDDRGGEILIRSSRTTKGAEVGDEAGRLNFVIDSASYNDIETSGSVAQIVAKVTDENPDGVFGGLSLQVADSAKNGSVERIFIDPSTTHITGTLAVSSYVRTTAQNNALGSLRIGSYGSSIDSGDLSVQSEIEVFGNTENALRLVNGGITLASTSGKGNITASGAISASGTIVGSNLSGTNTGDQDLSPYIQNSQTSSMSVATASLANEVAYTNITGKPTLISSSGQVDHDATTNFDAAEHFTQANITTVGTVTSGDISAILPTGTVSSSAQIATDISGAFISTSASIASDIATNASNISTNTSNISTLTAATSSYSTATGVEDNADVTDTANVTAAGALMDSEVTNLAQVKAFDSSDYATAAQGALADTAIQPSQTSSFSTATGVEDNADVTDTANVTAAGALMDSEVTSLSLIKGLTATQISGAFDSVSASLAADIPTNNNQLTNGAGYTANTGTVTNVTVGTGLDVTNGTTTPNVTLDLTEITLSNGLDSTATGLTLDLTEVIATDGASRVLTSDGDGTLTAESSFTHTSVLTTITQNTRILGILSDESDDNGTLNNTGEYGYGAELYKGPGVSDVSAGRVYYMNSSGTMTAAATGSEADVSGFIGVATSANSSDGLVLRGFVYTGTSGTIGSKVYVGSSGVPTTTKPTTSGDFVRLVGHLVYSNIIYFNPSNEYIELA